MIDGRILEFRLTEVTEDALVGVSEEVRFDEIALLERDKAVLDSKKACLVSGYVAGGWLIICLASVLLLGLGM